MVIQQLSLITILVVICNIFGTEEFMESPEYFSRVRNINTSYPAVKVRHKRDVAPVTTSSPAAPSTTVATETTSATPETTSTTTTPSTTIAPETTSTTPETTSITTTPSTTVAPVTTSTTTTPSSTGAPVTTSTTTTPSTTGAPVTTRTTPKAKTTVGVLPSTTSPNPAFTLKMLFKILRDFNQDLANSSSSMFNIFKSDMEATLTANYKKLNGFVRVYVLGFRSGSVITDFVLEANSVNSTAIATLNSQVAVDLQAQGYSVDRSSFGGVVQGRMKITGTKWFVTADRYTKFHLK
nr:cell wall protein DAN4-like isoform X2 [Paramormyrops kingsleyae]